MKTVLCALLLSRPRFRLLPAACSLLAMSLAGCDRSHQTVAEPSLNVPPGAYNTLSEKAKVVVGQDGKVVLVRDGKAVPHRVEKRGETMVIVATDDGEVFKPLSPGQAAPARTTPVYGKADLQQEQRRQEWERERAEKMKQAEGARQHALAMMKEARARAEKK